MRQIDDSIRIYAESGWEILSLCSWRVLGIVSSITPLLAALVSVSPFHLHAKPCLASCDMYCPFGVICPCVGFVERSYMSPSVGMRYYRGPMYLMINL